MLLFKAARTFALLEGSTDKMLSVLRVSTVGLAPPMPTKDVEEEE